MGVVGHYPVLLEMLEWTILVTTTLQWTTLKTTMLETMRKRLALAMLVVGVCFSFQPLLLCAFLLRVNQQSQTFSAPGPNADANLQEQPLQCLFVDIVPKYGLLSLQTRFFVEQGMLLVHFSAVPVACFLQGAVVTHSFQILPTLVVCFVQQFHHNIADCYSCAAEALVLEQ